MTLQDCGTILRDFKFVNEAAQFVAPATRPDQRQTIAEAFLQWFVREGYPMSALMTHCATFQPHVPRPLPIQRWQAVRKADEAKIDYLRKP